MTEWIKCSERLPQHGWRMDRYLVFGKCKRGIHTLLAYFYPYPCCEINLAYWDSEKFVFSQDNKPTFEITHWAELPEAPND